jgi:hypothetical protein
MLQVDLTTTAPAEIVIENEADIVMARFRIESALSRLKDFKAALDTATIAYFKANGIREIAISDTAKLYIAQDDKEKWDTEKVYDLFSFPPHCREVLEANPNFRKKAIEAKVGEKIIKRKFDEVNAEALIIITPGEKVVVKEFDKKFVKVAK